MTDKKPYMAETQPSASVPPGDLFWILPLLQGVFVVEDVTAAVGQKRAIRLRGRFLVDSGLAFERLSPLFRARGRTLRVMPDGDRAALLISEGIIQPTPNNRWLPPLLAVLTVLSILTTSTLLWHGDGLTWSNLGARLGQGLQFTASLVAILLAHELGHYAMARRFGVAVTLPYLIPFPLSLFGTMGAVIRIKDIPPNRRSLLLIGAAGPLAGLLICIPILILGISLSPVAALPAEGGYLLEGNSLLYGGLKALIHGQWLPSQGMDMDMHPIAFAGWAGLLITSLNLLPAGQLDGGHAARALLGAKARYLTWALIAMLLLLGLVWQGWVMWAVLVFVFSLHQVEPLDTYTALGRREMAIAALLLVLFALTFTPIPLRTVL
jgi:membrane-associated protease RseP (regulator of RpoE activity)